MMNSFVLCALVALGLGPSPRFGGSANRPTHESTPTATITPAPAGRTVASVAATQPAPDQPPSPETLLAKIPDTTDAELAALKDTPELRLKGPKITDAVLAQLKGMKSLTRLSLWGTKVTDAGLAQLKEIKDLKQLALTCTAVTDAGLTGIKEMMDLRSLDLIGTLVTDAGLAQLKDLTHLRNVDLGLRR